MSKSPNEDNTLKSWEVRVRPMAFSHEPWQSVIVAAQSPMQADAILRRQGYETLTGSVQRTRKNAQPISPSRPQPVACTKCGYDLDGLTIESTHIRCPECAFNQTLLSWSPEVEVGTKIDWWIGVLAVFGLACLLGLCALVLVFLFAY